MYLLLLPPRADIIYSEGLLLSAMNTHLGCIDVGALRELSSSPLVILTLETFSSMDGLLQQFWEVEELPLIIKRSLIKLQLLRKISVKSAFKRLSPEIRREDFALFFCFVSKYVQNQISQK